MSTPSSKPRRSWLMFIPWLLFVGWAILVLWASLDVRPFRPMVRLLAWDKLQHAAAYALLTLFGGFALRSLFQNRTLWAWLAAFLFSCTYGLTVEVLQHLATSSRRGDPLDLLADVAGSLLILCVVLPFELKNRVS